MFPTSPLSRQTPLLNAKGLLTAMVTVLLSGQALAGTAGRVTFVSGEVTAISSDGSRRVLTKSELVNSGERLETGKGRLQVRFTDGSFISLQPNTVFGLDNYTFARNKPQEGSLLFNFVRGGMRTISGAIGKVNRANYTVKTPVGTIGIRGTGYVATQEPNGRLLLTVNKGIVNISNDFGNSNVLMGQTFQIEPNKAPEPAPQGLAAEVLAKKPVPRTDNPDPDKDGDTDKTDETHEPDVVNLGMNNDANAPDFANGDQTNEDGQLNVTVFPFVIQSVDGVPRLSSFGSLLKGSSGAMVTQNVLAAYDTVGSDGQMVGNLIGLISTPVTQPTANNTLLLDTRKANNPLQFSNVKQIRSLSFGEWTNGQAAYVDNLLNISALNLTATQFMPYIVGTTSSKDLGNNQKINYSLEDATPARAGSSVGQLTQLNISIDLNLVPLVDVNLAVNIDNSTYTANVQNRALSLNLDKKLTGFALSGVSDNFFATSSGTNSNICANNGCPVNLSAFFSGSDLGAVYEIDRPNTLASIGGVAVLTGGTPSTISLPSNRVPSSLNNGYSALFSNNAGININSNPVSQLSAIFDTSTGGWRAGFHTQTTNGIVSATDMYGVTTGINNLGNTLAAANISQVGHAENTLTWGVWSNGLVDINNATQDVLLSPTQQIHYILGLPTTAAAIPSNTSSHAFYAFQNGTTPTVNASGLTGSLSSSSYLDFDFGSNTVVLNLDMALLSNTQSLALNATGQTTLNRVANAGTFNFDNLNVKLGAGNFCNSLGCSATASGFLAGNTADWAALNYSINAVSAAVNNGLFITTEGVAAFKFDTTQAAPISTLADTSSFDYVALLSKQVNDNPEISVTSTALDNVKASFDPTTLALKTAVEDVGEGTVTYGVNPTAAIAATEVTHYKQTLSWGRWINTDIQYGNLNRTVKLAANDTVHYIVGAPTLSLPNTTDIVSYHFIGSTTPTGTLSTPTQSGSPASTLSAITGVSVLNDSVVKVDFGNQNSGISLDLGLTTIANGDIRMTGTGALNTSFSVNNLMVTAGTNAAVNCGTCSANGFFAGANAELIGLNYNVKAPLAGGDASIAGVAAFEGTVTPNP